MFSSHTGQLKWQALKVKCRVVRTIAAHRKLEILHLCFFKLVNQIWRQHLVLLSKHNMIYKGKICNPSEMIDVSRMECSTTIHREQNTVI